MRYGFIGCGNMGGALIRAAVKTEEPGNIMIADSDANKAQALSEETGAVIGSASEVAGTCSQIFLGVKPYGMEALFDEIRPVLLARKDRFVLVTMAAGVPIARIRSYASAEVPVIRIMPNLPVSVGEGMIVYCCGKEGPAAVSEEETAAFLRILSRAGKLCEVTEEQIDAGTALSGSGPGFICYFIEALTEGGMKVGFTKEDAEMLAVQTVRGTADLLDLTKRDPADLRRAVCSPHGTTLAGLSALEEGSFYQDVVDAVIRAYNRAKEL